LQPFAVKLNGFRQNARKLTNNKKSGHILNNVIKILCLADGKGTTYKASIPATFSKLLWQNKSLQKVNITKLTGNISSLTISDLVARFGCSLSY